MPIVKRTSKCQGWANRLQRYNERHQDKHTPATENDTLQHLRELYKCDSSLDLKNADEKEDISYGWIPKFFVHKKKCSALKEAVQKLARQDFLDQRENELLDEHEQADLWDIIETHESDPKGMSTWLNYDAFTQVRAAVVPKTQGFFTPSTFLKFPQDPYGRISANALFRYIVRKTELLSFQITLLRYDDEGQGRLREDNVEQYVLDQIPDMAQLAHLETEFYTYYMYTAVRKFFFVLDPKQLGYISVSKLAHSKVFGEFNRMRHQPTKQESGYREGEGAREGAPPRLQFPAWFSVDSAMEVYSEYVDLDQDHNGMLSKKEFLRYNGGSLTEVFVDRVFQENRMYESADTGELEMDFKTFIDFVLASRTKHKREGLRYFWRMLDINREGFLTVFTLNYFFRAVKEKMEKMGSEALNARDIVANEIFDMIDPAEPLKITMEDARRSQCAGALISMLTDVKGFWQYDNREVQLNDGVDET